MFAFAETFERKRQDGYGVLAGLAVPVDVLAGGASAVAAASQLNRGQGHVSEVAIVDHVADTAGQAQQEIEDVELAQKGEGPEQLCGAAARQVH